MKGNFFKSLCSLFLTVLMVILPLSGFNAYASVSQDLALIPQKAITRGEFAMLINTSLSLQGEADENFLDVPKDHPYAVDFLCAKAFGYMHGDESGNIHPDSLITGVEAAVIISRLLGFDSSKVDVVTGLSVPEWANLPVSVLIDFGIINNEIINKNELNINDAYTLINSLYIAKMLPGSPYALTQTALKDDFYAYINRQYLATATSEPGYMIAMPFVDASVVVQQQQQEILNEILTSDNLTPSSDEWKIKELYNMYMDNETRTASISKVQPYLNEIRDADSIEELLTLAKKHINYFNLQPFYSISAYSDARTDASKWAVFIMPSSLDLGSKDYYADNEMIYPVQQTYREYVGKLLQYMGETDNIEERVNNVYEIEKTRAELSLPAEIASSPDVLYTETTWDYMLEATSTTNTLTYSPEILDLLMTMNIYCPNISYVMYVESLYTEENLQALKDVAMLTVLSSVSSMLGDDLSKLSVDLQISLYGGVESSVPLEKRAQNFVTNMMSSSFSRIYAERYVAPQVKADVTGIVESIRDKYRERISSLPWMGTETKQAAIDKLDSIKAYVAYPDEPTNSVSYQVVAKENGGCLVDLYLSICEARYTETVDALKKPFQHNLWNMISVSTVDAFYSPSENAIVIPAGILQKPFYNPDGSREENLGALGAIIAHEFTHAFDDRGAQYDKNGTLNDWWSKEDYAEFSIQADRVAASLSSIDFFNGNYVNGLLCTSEAIADMGGIACVIDIAKDDPNTDLSKVMESWASIWAARMTPETALLLLYNDNHLPYKLRVNYVLAQMDDFYLIYNINEGDGMYVPQENRINIW